MLVYLREEPSVRETATARGRPAAAHLRAPTRLPTPLLTEPAVPPLPQKPESVHCTRSGPGASCAGVGSVGLPTTLRRERLSV